METKEIDVLKARLASYINAVTFWRKSCEEAQAKIQRLEKLFADANRRAYEAEQARDAALMGQPSRTGQGVAGRWGCR